MANDGLVGESLMNMGAPGPARPVNTFSIWRYLLLIIVIGVAALYALPNLYPPDAALQVRPVGTEDVADQALLDQSVAVLAAANIQVLGTELSDNALLRVSDSDTQVAAASVLADELNRDGDAYTIALNQAATTPDWLRDIGGKPMSYGLDLSGGVHFLLQVDMEGFLTRRAGITAATVERLLKDNNIRGATSRRRFEWVNETTISIPFRTAANRDAALPFLRDVNNLQGYDIDTRVVDGKPGLRLQIQDQLKRELEDYAISQNLQSLRNRVNELGVSEPLVQRLGRSRIVLDLPGVRDSAEAKKIINKFANLEFRLVAGQDVSRVDSEDFEYEGSAVRLLRENIVTGDQVTNAQQDYDPDSGQPQVSISLDADGGRRMNAATKDNIGKPMSVLFLESKTRERKQIVDGEEVIKIETTETKRVINVATIQAALGFNFRITGVGLGEARELALLLRAGALAAPMYIVEERTVGPQLGKENIERGFTSLFIGLALVAGFMVLYYKLFGVAAVLALSANLILIVAILSVLGATLTLPGIAGIVLTIGMAVDANVLIFSRIREELRDRAPQAAIQAGFDRAFLTILDANITTFFVAIILLSIGSGPVKGFAITLAIGIVTSMFTAILGTRGIVNLIYGGRKLTKLAI